MWFLDKLIDDPAVYTIAVGVRWRGPLHVEALAWAVDRLVERHEALRSGLVTDDAGMPYLVIDAAMGEVLQLVDLRHEDDPVAAAESAIVAAAHTRIALDRGPLFRTALYALDADDHVLSIAAWPYGRRASGRSASWGPS